MKLADFLDGAGTEKNLSELILFLGKQSLVVKKGFLGTAGTSPAGEKTRNVYGEEQMPLDKFADGVFIDALHRARLVRSIATEEQEQVIEIENPKNAFGIVMDPLDGSSLIDVNLAIGTIIGIFPGSVLEKGSRLIAALYILYGPLTTLTYTTGKGVHEFVLDETGEFVLRHQNLRIPEGKIYAPGALRKDYLPAHARWIEHLEQSGTDSASAAVLLPMSTRSSTKAGCLRIPASKERRRGNCASCTRQIRWESLFTKPAERSVTGQVTFSTCSRKQSARSPPSISGERTRSP